MNAFKKAILTKHTRKCLRFGLLLSLLWALLCAVPVFAAEWSEEYYRATDLTGELTSKEREALDTKALELLSAYHVDVAALVVNEEELEEGLAEHARAFYEACEYGYGENKDGILLIYAADTGNKDVVYGGSAEGIISEEEMVFVLDSVPEYYEKYGMYGIVYSFFRFMELDLEEAVTEGRLVLTSDGSGDSVDTRGETADSGKETIGSEAEGSDTDPLEKDGALSGIAVKPAWYPEDPSSFVFYHDPNAPRVVDTADIFSDEEEREMAARISELTEKHGKDVVVFTDNSSYGLEHEIYAADFYDFNGYGIGDDYEGLCLMIDMDPNDRGWFVCATGPVSERLLSAENGEALDDRLFPFMAHGAYGEGVLDWLENIDTLYTKEVPFAPDWLPALSERERFVYQEDHESRRVLDSTGKLSEEQLDELEARAREIAGKYGVDIAVNLTDSTYGMGHNAYADAVWQYNGYGFGEAHDLILAVIVDDSSWVTLNAMGRGEEKLTEVNHDRICDQVGDHAYDGHMYEAASLFLRHTEHMLRTGRVRKSLLSWIARLIIALIIGAVFAQIRLFRAAAKMVTVKAAKNANAYVSENSSVRIVRNIFLYSNVTQRRIPRSTSDSSSSRSSGSSGSYHRSSYSGSSGRSHSGSGRRF